MNSPNITIGLLAKKEIDFVLYGDFSAKQGDKKFSGVYSAKLKDKKIVVTHNGESITVNEITFKPADVEIESFLLKNVKIGIDFHWQKNENLRYRGSLKLIIHNNEILVINIAPVEMYLTSVIASEMSPNSSISLLKAHAIISRSWLLAQLEKKKNKNSNYDKDKINTPEEICTWYDRENHTLFDFCADDHCQRYQGITRINTDNTFNAVESTYGLVLYYRNQICDTRFSKCCGGITESFENTWEPVKYPCLSSIIDYKFEPDGILINPKNEIQIKRWIQNAPFAFCNTTDKKILSQVLPDIDKSTTDFYRWSVEYTQDELAQIIFSKSGIDFGNIIDLIPLKRGDSGRIIKLNIIGTKHKLIVGKELEIRKFLSKSHLYSSAFFVIKDNIVKNIPGKFIIKGAGWGHGVGLCQIGAAVMGEMGYTFDEILLHYFKNTIIHKAY